MGKSDSPSFGISLGGMVGNGGRNLAAPVVGFLIISNFLAVVQNIAAEINILIVEFAHLPPFTLL